MDRAVYIFGSGVQNAIEAVEDDDPKARQSKQYSLLLKYMGVPDEKRYASLTAFGE